MLVTLPLHVLRELGKALGLSIMVFGFILLAFAAGQMMRDGAGIFTVISMMPHLFPLMSPMVLPLTIITGTLICYGRLASGNEFTAAQAGGVHPMWLAVPAVLVAVLATSITVFLNADVLDLATSRIEQAIMSDMTGILRRQLSKPGSILFYDRVICRMKSESGHAGIDITRFSTDAGGPKEGEGAFWDPDYPHQVERIIARDHEISLEPDEQGDLYVQVRLKHFHAFDLTSSKIQPVIGETGNPRWPAAKDIEVNISPKRLAYTGFLSLIRMRHYLHGIMRQLAAAVLVEEDVLDWRRLAVRLRHDEGESTGSPAWRLWINLGGQERALVRRLADGETLAAAERQALLRTINQHLMSATLFDLRPFRVQALPVEAQTLLTKRKEGGLAAHDVLRLNRLLLEAALPGVLRHREPESIEAVAGLQATLESPATPEGLKKVLREKLKSHNKQTAEIHLKLSLSFACLGFALVGIPLGLLTRRQNTSTGFGFGVLIAVSYYLVVKALQTQVRAGFLGWGVIWIPNIFLVLLGVILWVRSKRID